MRKQTNTHAFVSETATTLVFTRTPTCASTQTTRIISLNTLALLYKADWNVCYVSPQHPSTRVCSCMCVSSPADWKGEARRCSKLFIALLLKAALNKSTTARATDERLINTYSGKRHAGKREGGAPRAVLTWVLAAGRKRWERKEKGLSRASEHGPVRPCRAASRRRIEI